MVAQNCKEWERVSIPILSEGWGYFQIWTQKRGTIEFNTLHVNLYVLKIYIRYYECTPRNNKGINNNMGAWMKIFRERSPINWTVCIACGCVTALIFSEFVVN